MNAKEKLIITQNIKAQLKGAPVAPICISGKPGTSKSTTVRLIAEELNMNIVECSGPVLSHEALSGLPDTVDAQQYQANSIDGCVPQATQWSIPEIMAQTIRAAADKPTVLLIDDFHMVSPHLQAYFYGLLLDRRLGNYRLSDNTAIVLTMNDSQKAGLIGINSAVRNRLSILRVDFDFDYWMNSYGNGLHYLVASFLKTKPQYCIEDETTDIIGYASPRAWTAIAHELSFYEPEFILANGGLIAGMQVSNEASRAFQQHIVYVAALDFEKTVKNKVLTDLSTKDPLDSIIYAYITNFIETVEDGLYLFDLMNSNAKQSSFIGFTLGEIYVKFKNQDKAQLSDGILFVIDRLLSHKKDPSKYVNTKPSTLDKAFDTPIQNLNSLMEKTAEYLI